MGDRAQVAIKTGSGKVYLYGHWIGSDIYKAVAKAFREVPGRLNDNEYLARAIFVRMIGDNFMEETGFGIGTAAHGDIEHAIPVLDPDNRRVTWEAGAYASETPEEMSFAEFAKKAEAGDLEQF